ncbi:hypothetical protein B0H13DRAFT_1977474, partial [Mycena leptocephala]
MDPRMEVCSCMRSPVWSESMPTAAMYKFIPSAVSPPLPVVPARRPPLSSAAYPTSRPPIHFDSDDANLWIRPPHCAILDALNAAEAATRDNDFVVANPHTPAPAATDANASDAATTRVRRVGLAGGASNKPETARKLAQRSRFYASSDHPAIPPRPLEDLHSS